MCIRDSSSTVAAGNSGYMDAMLLFSLRAEMFFRSVIVQSRGRHTQTPVKVDDLLSLNNAPRLNKIKGQIAGDVLETT